jgi:SAM-dependent methyltransferase
LESGSLYELVQRQLGGDAARRRLVNEFVRPQRDARILDIGCGTGTILQYLPEDVVYVGYDLSPKYIAQARARHGHRGRFLEARVEDDRTVDGDFDLVLAMGILHHLDDHAADLLIAGAQRRLRPGGVLITCDPVRHGGQPTVAKLLIALDRGRCVRTAEGYHGLVASRFAEIESAILIDLLPVPYSHFVMRAHNVAA